MAFRISKVRVEPIQGIAHAINIIQAILFEVYICICWRII